MGKKIREVANDQKQKFRKDNIFCQDWNQFCGNTNPLLLLTIIAWCNFVFHVGHAMPTIGACVTRLGVSLSIVPHSGQERTKLPNNIASILLHAERREARDGSAMTEMAIFRKDVIPT
jgi:hypothetical protein